MSQPGRVDANADNVRIMHSSKEDTVTAVQRFLLRCRLAGCHLNEVDVFGSDLLREAESVVRDVVDFFGEVLNLKAKTSRAREKHKIKAVEVTSYLRNAGRTALWRSLIGAIALGLWSAPIFRIDLATLGDLFLVLQIFGREVAEDSSLWDHECGAPDSVLERVCHVLEPLAKNDDTAIDQRLRRATPFQVLIVDACAGGWGAFSVRPQNGSVRTFRARWAARVQHSAQGEPAGIEAAVRASVPRDATGTVRIWTDHRSFPGAWRRQRSYANHINEVILRLRRDFPGVDFDLRYIPGTDNPADGISRDLEPTDADFVNAIRIACAPS